MTDDYNPAFVEELLQAAAAPPEAVFTSVEDALAWLNA